MHSNQRKGLEEARQFNLDEEEQIVSAPVRGRLQSKQIQTATVLAGESTVVWYNSELADRV